MHEVGRQMGMSAQSVMRRIPLYGMTARKGLWQNGSGVHPNTGKKFTAETRKRISEAKKGKPQPRMERSAHWKGGRYLDRNGYLRLKLWGHPSANKWGMVMEHVVVAEQMIGRQLTEREIVHHKNGIRNDNRPENLEVKDAHEHSRMHAAQRKQAFADLVRGLGRIC